MDAQGHRVGPKTKPVAEIASMEEFVKEYEAQLAYATEAYYFRIRNRNERFNQKHYPEPFLSLFCFDCIGRGLDINDGGAIYPMNHGAGVTGIATTADSLAAIEKAVFVDKKYTLVQLKEALDKNFEGFEDMRSYLLDAPKYGNNDDFVDKYAMWLVKFMSECFSRYKTRDGGHYIIGMASNVSNVLAGRVIGATPDGRLAGEPVSDAASPAYGRDRKGVTSALLSLAKPDYTYVSLGSVINQKYSPSMFTDDKKRAKLLALIRTYFSCGGQELQMNATSREVLIDAMNHPENYKDLVVRVSGFSAYYVTLDPGVQLDILNRTQQG
jgi:formate C-acetyltransferase